MGCPQINVNRIFIIQSDVAQKIESIIHSFESSSTSELYEKNKLSDNQCYLELMKSIISFQQAVQHIYNKRKIYKHKCSNIADSPNQHLTCKEVETLDLLAKGFSYNEVAEILQCKVSTVQTHIKRIYKKLNVHSRSEAVFEFISLDNID